MMLTVGGSFRFLFRFLGGVGLHAGWIQICFCFDPWIDLPSFFFM